MPDFEDVLTRTAVDSDIIRVRPGAVVRINICGTETLVWEGLSDANGHFSVPTLAAGKYDLLVDGRLARTFHHVTADHVHLADQTWTMTRHGAQTVTRNEDQNCAVFVTPAAGTIISLVATAERIADDGDITIHLLKGAASGAGALTCASNSVWNRRVYNDTGSTIYLYPQSDIAPEIAVAANEAVTMGMIFAAIGVEGLTLTAIFRPTVT